MKKLFVFALAVMFSIAGFAKNTQDVINDIRQATNAQVLTLSKDLIQVQAKNLPEDLKGILDNIEEGTIVVLSEGSDEQIKLFNDKLGELDAKSIKQWQRLMTTLTISRFWASLMATMLPNLSLS